MHINYNIFPMVMCTPFERMLWMVLLYNNLLFFQLWMDVNTPDFCFFHQHLNRARHAYNCMHIRFWTLLCTSAPVTPLLHVHKAGSKGPEQQQMCRRECNSWKRACCAMWMEPQCPEITSLNNSYWGRKGYCLCALPVGFPMIIWLATE